VLEGRLLPTAFLVDRLDDSTGSPGTCLDGTANDCTLRDAITKANSATGPHTISLDPSITLPAITDLGQTTALPTIAQDVTIEDRLSDGNTNPEWTIERGGSAGSYRILTVGSGVTATLSEVKLRLGTAPKGAGVYNSGTLTVQNTVIQDNQATGVAASGDPLMGGGIYNAQSATLDVEDSTVQGNEVYGNGAGAYYGAGIYSHGTLTVTGSTISNNIICDTSVPRPCAAVTGLFIFFSGAGIYSEAATATVSYTTIKGNLDYAVDPGHWTFKGEGAGIRAICDTQPTCLDLSYSTVSGNEVHTSGTAEQNAPGAAVGGGIGFSGLDSGYTGKTTVLNTTITGNLVTSSVTGLCDTDCRAAGGGLWFKWGNVDMQWSTVAANTAHSSSNAGSGGGITVSTDHASLTLKAAIVANNTDDAPTSTSTKNIDGTITTDNGYNLLDDAPSGSTGTGDLKNKAVCFLALADNGGPSAHAHTDTLEPQACLRSSVWARNHGPASGLGDDQRTFHRPDGTATDIGAFECQGTECPVQGSGPSNPVGGGGGSTLMTALALAPAGQVSAPSSTGIATTAAGRPDEPTSPASGGETAGDAPTPWTLAKRPGTIAAPSGHDPLWTDLGELRLAAGW
jgi:hypothetical protein